MSGRRFENPDVVYRDLSINDFCGSNSVVECQLPKLDVAGSSPVSRSEKQRSAVTNQQSALRQKVKSSVVANCKLIVKRS